MTKTKSIPDPTRGKTRLIWENTYDWTVNFFNEHPELKVGAEIGVAGGQHIKAIMEETKVEKMYGVDPYINDSWDMHEFFDVDKAIENKERKSIRRIFEDKGEKWEGPLYQKRNSGEAKEGSGKPKTQRGLRKHMAAYNARPDVK